MTGVSIVFVVLLIYTAVLFFIEREDINERLVLGGMVIDVLAAEESSGITEYYLEKSGQYALLKSVKKTTEEGFLDENCEAYYSGEGCKINVYDFADSVKKNLPGYFEEYIIANKLDMDVKKYKFDVVVAGGKVMLYAETSEKIDFGDASVREMEYKKSGNFNTELNFAFSQYLEAIESIESNILCLLESEDEQVKEDLGSSSTRKNPKECLDDKFFNVKKKNGILSFKYKMKGALFEENLDVKLDVNLKGLGEGANL